MPNGADKKLNFVAKVYDPVTLTYRPLYIAPDATDVVQGDVFLTDEIDETKTAAEGMTAITPAGIKTLADKIAKDIDAANPYKTTSVGSATVPIYLDTGTFKEITGMDASMITSGTIALERLPQGALERLVPVENKAARFKLTKEQVQIGDVVQELDTTTMYVVVDENNLDNENGYKVFSAGRATLAEAANKLSKPVNINDVSFDGTKDITVYDNTKLPLTGGKLTGHLYGQYLVGTWLQTTATTNLGKAPERYPVLDPAGWLYFRTLAETQTDLDILKKSGDTTTGKLTIGKGISFKDSPEFQNYSNPQYFVTMNSFQDGSTAGWADTQQVVNSLWGHIQTKINSIKNSLYYLGEDPATNSPGEWNNLGFGYATISSTNICCPNDDGGMLVNYPISDAKVFQHFYGYDDTQFFRQSSNTSGMLQVFAFSEWKKTYPAGSGSLVVAGDKLAVSTDLLVSDPSASTGFAVGIVSTSSQLVGTSLFEVPFGSYSIVVRAQVNNIADSNDIFQIVVLANDIIIKTTNVKPTYFTAANSWLPIGTGVNFGSNAPANMIVQIKSLGSTTSTAKIDSVTVMNSPVAVNMIG